MIETTSAVTAAHNYYDILKDFQPAVAAAIAFVVALIAYKGVALKVKEDRRSRAEDKLGERYGLLLRLASTAKRLQIEYGVYLRNDFYYENFAKSITSESVREFEDAWNQIALLPRESIVHLDNAKFFVRLGYSSIIRNGAPLTGENRKTVEGMLKTNCELVEEACGRLYDPLQPTIGELADKLHITTSHRATQGVVPSTRSQSRENSDR